VTSQQSYTESTLIYGRNVRGPNQRKASLSHTINSFSLFQHHRYRDITGLNHHVSGHFVVVIDQFKLSRRSLQIKRGFQVQFVRNNQRNGRTKVRDRNDFTSSFHSPRITSFSPSSASFNRSHTRPKSISFRKPSPTCCHAACRPCARVVLKAGQ
jgi:hypothetical protein